jgi:aryl-alcohol dehydrogenase-like predicted oxidoreductase
MKYCLGTVQFGQDYGIRGSGQPQRESVYEMLSYAIKNGITEFDTAAAYGDAEEVLGDYIRKYPEVSKEMRIVSKLHPEAFLEVDERKWNDIAVERAKRSLDILGIEHFSAYHFHRPQYLFNPKAVEALYKVKDAGLTEVIGVSTYTPEEAMKALEWDEIEAIQIPYNVFDRRLDKAGFFEKARGKGLRVYARSSLLQGLALMDPDHLPDRVEFAKNELLKFRKICKEYDLTPLQAAIGYVSEIQEIDFVVFGVDNITQLKEYISLEDVDIPIEAINCYKRAFESSEERLVNPVLWK